jgi:hypothetical protein
VHALHKVLLKEVGEFYALVALSCLDSGFLSRESCNFIVKEIGAKPRIFPKKGVTLNARGSQARKDMLLWICQRHAKLTARISQEIHNRDDQLQDEVNDSLCNQEETRGVERKTSEMLAKIIVCNIRRPIYLHFA